ncbi:hypothetical protein F2P79_009160 [Pimephales promelas]|nr:hypothetical protein F2P79_009160 [Pimephales promelas]
MKEVINENTKQITSVKEAIEFMSEEVNSLKLKYGVVEAKVGKVDQATNEQERRLAHLESYSRRWNLRFHGVPEKEREDVRQRIIQLCQQLLPEDKDKLPNAIDTVHRLGRKEPNKSRGIICQFASRFFRDAVWRAAKESAFLRENGLKISEDLSPADKERRNKLWPIIMQFTGRHFRDELWRITKLHSVCKDLNIRFAEDLTKEDRVARMAVWPEVEQARKAGLKTVFRGPHAFINGQRVLP